MFEPLLETARYKGAHGGRGSGKSHFMAELTIEEHLMYPGLRTVCVREVQKSLKESIKRLLEDKIKAMGVSSMFNALTTEIQTPGDGLIVFQGMQDHTADSIKSYENFNRSLAEESHTLSEKSIELLYPTIRNAGSAPRAELRFVWNPRNASDPVEHLLRGLDPPKSSIIVESNWKDNPWFPTDLEEDREHDKKHKPDRYSHIWEGAFEPQVVGAIWNRQTLHACRVAKMPCTRERTIVAVDHAVSDTATSNEHGITVQALGSDQRGYLLEDLSLSGSPHQWATMAVAAFDKWDADNVVIERNQGGDLVKHTLQTIRKNLPIIEVVATRGKHVRAAPIAAMYPLGMISHVGTFPEIESQMCQFTSSGWMGPDTESPDRAEAAIWGFTQLFHAITMDKAPPKPKTQNRPKEGAWLR